MKKPEAESAPAKKSFAKSAASKGSFKSQAQKERSIQKALASQKVPLFEDDKGSSKSSIKVVERSLLESKKEEKSEQLNETNLLSMRDEFDAPADLLDSDLKNGNERYIKKEWQNFMTDFKHSEEEEKVPPSNPNVESEKFKSLHTFHEEQEEFSSAHDDNDWQTETIS